MASKTKQQRSGESEKTGTAAARERPQPAAGNNWIDAVWKLGAVSAAIAIAVVAWLQWKTLSAIEELLDATHRPWVAASVEPVQLAFDDQGGGITLKMTIKNSGAGPATDVLTSPVLLLDAKQPYKTACSHYGIGGGIGPTLFNNDAFPKTSTAWLSRKDFGENFPKLVAVCIKYRFANGARTGETGYLFAIVQRDPGHPDGYVIEPKNGTLNPPELALLPTGSYQY